MLIVATEYLHAFLGNEDHVLHSNAESAGHVDSRLHRKDHSFLSPVKILLVNGRGFVDLEADPVAQRMAEVLPKSLRGDELARGGVYLSERDAGANGLDGFGLRPGNDLRGPT